MKNIWTLVCLSLAFGCTPEAEQPRPNIVLIVAEDMSSRVAAFGDPVAVTPNIDRLAREGVRFTNAFTTAGVCAPSRAALITGMYQQAIGAQHMRTSSFGRTTSTEFGEHGTEGPPYESVPPPDVKAFPEYLRVAGYYAANNFKTDYQIGTPFTVWDESSREASWENAPDGTPFFAMYAPLVSHESFLFRTDGEMRNQIHAQTVARISIWLEGKPEPVKPEMVTVPAFLPDTPLVRKDIARHYNNIFLMDQQVGRILDALEEAGRLDDTIIIWTTDHGDGLPRGKRSLYDSGIKVPLIVRFPDGQHAGTVRDDLVSFVDVAPAIMSLAGVPLPGHLQGQDFLDADNDREYVYAARDRLDEHPDRSRAVRDERFKYIRNFDADRPFFAPLDYRENIATMQELRRLLAEGKLTVTQAGYFATPRPAEELYDTDSDPDEVVNLADDPQHAQTLARFRTALEQFTASIDDTGTMSEKALLRQMWQGAEQPDTAPPDVSVTGKVVTLTCATEGASLGYRFDTDPQSRWRLYVEPFEPPPGITIEARAVRYGYRESPIVRVSL